MRTPCGVFLDPPYSTDERDPDIYAVDEAGVSTKVREWAIAHGDDPRLRIVLCGYEGEHDGFPPGWKCYAWKNRGGFGNQGGDDTRGKQNRHRERLWLSPHCLLLDETLLEDEEDTEKPALEGV
jgi:hypothetical protein